MTPVQMSARSARYGATAPCKALFIEVARLTPRSVSQALKTNERRTILIAMRGLRRLTWGRGSDALNPGDTRRLPLHSSHKISPAVTGEARLYRLRATDDTAGAMEAV